jgi:bleomycin hydrolase
MMMKTFWLIPYLFLFVCISEPAAQNNFSHNMLVPSDTSEFNPIWHFPPVNQDTTLVCWSFSTLSFMETEMSRIGKTPVKLAMMFPVYYAFIEKAKYFIENRGSTHFAPGDLFSTVLDVIQKYGIVPEEAYKGNIRDKVTYNHSDLYDELDKYMEQVKKNELWDEVKVLAQVRKILNKHLGKPPVSFKFRNVEYTPESFRDLIVSLPWNQYVTLTSFEYAPFDSLIALDVPDNWRKRKSYLNLPLTDFYNALERAISNGYSIAIDSDISEPGRIGTEDICIIPEYDIPQSSISQPAREYRFKTGITSDDHLMHIIGMNKNSSGTWFLVKDSWRDAWDGKHEGYFFFHEDYIKLKVLAFMVHRDAMPHIFN